MKILTTFHHDKNVQQNSKIDTFQNYQTEKKKHIHASPAPHWS